jgi:hypothetical protein
LLLIQEFANVFKDVILLVSENSVSPRDLGVPFLSLFVGDTKMARNTKEVALADFDSIVATTIGGTL